MTSSFNVHDVGAYEQLMGRWSKKLAPLLVDFAGLAEGERIIDVGCGNGSLTFALAGKADLREIVAIDYAPVFVEEAIRRNSDPRIKIQRADACDLPFGDGVFDRSFALLVLHFVPEAGKAVAEMRRVVRQGGVVAAAVWDHLGGMPGMRMMVDTVAALSEAGRQMRNRYFFQPMMQPGEMKRTFVEQGLLEVTEAQLLVRMDYRVSTTTGRPSPPARGPSENMSPRSTRRNGRAPTPRCATPMRRAGPTARGLSRMSHGLAAGSRPDPRAPKSKSLRRSAGKTARIAKV